jgi:hypothetical protein
MATLSYEEWKARKNSASSKEFKVGYFNALRDDGDTALVRFDYDSVKEFTVQDIHRIRVNDKWRSVVCPRGRYDSKDSCPLCKAGEYASSKVYVKLLEYVKDETGKIVAQAKVWERPAKFIQKIIGAYNDASELGLYPMNSKISDIVFKVTRNGAKGAKDTDYDIKPANPSIYKPEMYVKDFADFEGLDLAHHSYMVRTVEEIQYYMDHGEFPPFKKDGDAPAKPAEDAPSIPADNVAAHDEFPSSPVTSSPKRTYEF